MANLVLLAENRLSLPTENRVTPLRVGFLAQFLLIAAWALSFINEPASVRSNALQALGVIGGLHLALVAMFTVTEDLVAPAPRAAAHEGPVAVAPAARDVSSRRRPRRHLRAGADGAAPRDGVAASTRSWPNVRWFLAVCGYICFFTGVPAVAFRLIWPGARTPFQLRVAVLLLVPARAAAARPHLLRALAAGRLQSQLLRPPSDQSVPDAGELGPGGDEALVLDSVRRWA